MQELIEALKELLQQFEKEEISAEELHIRRDNLLICYIGNAEVTHICNSIHKHIWFA